MRKQDENDELGEFFKALADEGGASKVEVGLLLEKSVDSKLLLKATTLVLLIFCRCTCLPACFDPPYLSRVAQDGMNALMFALDSGASIEVVELLINEDADVKAKDRVPFSLSRSCVLADCDEVFMPLFDHFSTIVLFSPA
jgi:hypothetical protein